MQFKSVVDKIPICQAHLRVSCGIPAMGWSPDSAVAAYLDTVKLCKLHHERRYSTACLTTKTEPQSTEFISALAAGMNAQLMVEVSCGAASFTIALAVAARQTGGRLVRILPAGKRCSESMEAVRELGLEDRVEFVMGDPHELLPQYNNVDFALIDCKGLKDESGLFGLLKLNPCLAVVAANNLFDKKATAAYARSFWRSGGAKSITLPIGEGIEITRIVPTDIEMDDNARQKKWFGRTKPRWIVMIDERTGEEHFFRVPKHMLNSLQEQCCAEYSPKARGNGNDRGKGSSQPNPTAVGSIPAYGL